MAGGSIPQSLPSTTQFKFSLTSKNSYHPSITPSLPSCFPYTQQDIHPSLILLLEFDSPSLSPKPRLASSKHIIKPPFISPCTIKLNHFFILLLSQANLPLESSQTPPHSHSFVHSLPRPKPAKVTGKPPGLGTLGSAHCHLIPPPRSPTSPTLHRAVTGASVPTPFYPTCRGCLLSGPSTRSSQPESCDSQDRFPDSFPRASGLGDIPLRLREVRFFVFVRFKALRRLLTEEH
ncbi:hypothetical protein CRG98_047046, partial [Punica granatum]